VPIESIAEGAVVASVDPATGEPAPAVVTATPARLFEGTIYEITVDPGEPGGGDETTISATGEHPFLVARAGPRAAALDTRADPEAVALVEPLDTVDGRWVPARDLAEGDTVRTMSPQGVAGTATVTKVRARHAVTPVYNLTVRGTSRYLVGACGVVVHNKDPDKLYHYTSADPKQIMSEGLVPGRSGKVFTTPDGTLSPLQAQIDLALPPNRGLPNHLIEIDVGILRKLGIPIPRGGQVGRDYNMPGGGCEVVFPDRIPPAALRVVR